MSKRNWVLWVVVFALLELPALSCGPFFNEALFVLPNGPTDNYNNFVAGHLGVVQPDYRTRNLVVAFSWLTQRPLTPAEQTQAQAVNMGYLQAGVMVAQQPSIPNNPGFVAWMKTRAAFGPVDGYEPDADAEISGYTPDPSFQGYPTCLDDAYGTAAKTLAARQASYGAKDAGVTEWVRGQDAVFSNCGDSTPPKYVGRGPAPKDPLPVPDKHAPKPAPANAAAWLQKDRAYQLAATQFYTAQFDAALASFRAIAADTSSPWSTVSRYLIARALLRQCTIADDELNGPAGSDAAMSAAKKAALMKGLAATQQELLAMQKEPRMAPLQASITGLLNYVNLRLQPDKQAVLVAADLHQPGTKNFAQDLIDLTYLRTDHTDATQPAPPHGPRPDPTGLLPWIDTINSKDGKTALAQWHSTHQNAWLLAAITFAQPGDASSAELIKAASAVPPNDPAWAAVNYHRLRLMPSNAATRADVLASIAKLDPKTDQSTKNLFSELNASTAASLDDWLKSVGRVPAYYGDGMDFTNTDPADTTKPSEDMCGKMQAPNAHLLFDTDGAFNLNQRFPLALLAQAAQSKSLPDNLQFQIAQAAWVRAVVLDRPDVAKHMTPLLESCRATWKPVLDAYDAATTPDDRKAEGLLALMRFASTEPSVREGVERSDGFATYSEYRQNWWCTTVPSAGNTVDMENGNATDPNNANAPAASNDHPPATPPAPLFLTAADAAADKSEVATLSAIPNASDYFATQALAWVAAHPKDPRNADILGEADRVLRNGCRSDNTPKLAKALFDTLHKQYPQSEWTKKFKTWQ